MKHRSKSQQQILDAIDGVRRIRKTTKHHDRAIEQLKAESVIYKDENNILRRVKQFGIDLPIQASLSKRWTTPVWKRHAGKKVIAFVVYGDSRAESMDIADKLIVELESGSIL